MGQGKDREIPYQLPSQVHQAHLGGNALNLLPVEIDLDSAKQRLIKTTPSLFPSSNSLLHSHLFSPEQHRVTGNGGWSQTIPAPPWRSLLLTLSPAPVWVLPHRAQSFTNRSSTGPLHKLQSFRINLLQHWLSADGSFLQRTSICSGMGSSMGCQVYICSSVVSSGGIPAPESEVLSLPPPSTLLFKRLFLTFSSSAFLSAIQYFALSQIHFLEGATVPAEPWGGSPGAGCVWHGAPTASPHRGHRRSPYSQGLATHTQQKRTRWRETRTSEKDFTEKKDTLTEPHQIRWIYTAVHEHQTWIPALESWGRQAAHHFARWDGFLFLFIHALSKLGLQPSRPDSAKPPFSPKQHRPGKPKGKTELDFFWQPQRDATKSSKTIVLHLCVTESQVMKAWLICVSYIQHQFCLMTFYMGLRFMSAHPHKNPWRIIATG